MKTTLAVSLAKFADLNDGDLFIGKFNDRSHVMIKGFQMIHDDRVVWPVILSPTLDDFNNKPVLVQKSVVERSPVVRVGDFELSMSLDPRGMTIESGYIPDVGAIFLFEAGFHICARVVDPGWTDALINVQTGEIVERPDSLANAKITSWQIRRRIGDEVEIIVKYS